MFKQAGIRPDSRLTLRPASFIILGMSAFSENPEYLYSVPELARRWSVSERAVQMWCDKGVFPRAFRMGEGPNSRWRIPEGDVIDYERRRKINR